MTLTIVKKEISLNVGQPNNFELVCAMQGDNKSFEITATLYDVNKLYTISTNSIKLKGENPAGLTIHKNVDSHTTNTVTFTLTEDMLMYDGILKLVLVFTENGAQLTTFPFVIKVINSPGNNTADDIKTVSGLVEEAKKWAMLSKSYAVGTGNEVREGDAKDNSKYYYEQIKGLLDSGKIGNGKILYFETYGEFKKELDAGNIKNETLICIRENAAIDGGDSGNDNDKFDFSGKKLMLFVDSDNVCETNNLTNWDYTGRNSEKDYMPCDFDKCSIVYCNKMLFCFTTETGGTGYLWYTIHDFSSQKNAIWKFHSVRDGIPTLVYGNNHLLMIADGHAYITDDNSIIENRKTSIPFEEVEFNFPTPQALAYGNNIFIFSTEKVENNVLRSISAYSFDCRTWHGLSGLKSDVTNNKRKIVYGNKLFIHLSIGLLTRTGVNVDNIRILDSDNLGNGWSIPQIEYDGNVKYQLTDIVFDDKNNKFLIPYYDDYTNTSGFYIYDGTNWEKTVTNTLIKLYNCFCYQGNLFGMVNGTNWALIDNIKTYEYTDYGVVKGKFGSWYGNAGSYVLLDSPLWDIDNDAAT